MEFYIYIYIYTKKRERERERVKVKQAGFVTGFIVLSYIQRVTALHDSVSQCPQSQLQAPQLFPSLSCSSSSLTDILASTVDSQF
jgi:hypothetical protein